MSRRSFGFFEKIVLQLFHTFRLSMTEATEIINAKKEYKKKFLKFFPSQRKSRAILLNSIENPELKKHVDEACEAIGVFVLHGNEITDDIDSDTYFGAIDACVTDSHEKNPELDLVFMQYIVPIFPKESAYRLSEFNPMKFEGNGFFFKDHNPFCMFEKVVSYLENSKFPEDRRILLKHVLETF